jgi:hypothetical protein
VLVGDLAPPAQSGLLADDPEARLLVDRRRRPQVAERLEAQPLETVSSCLVDKL